MLPIEKPFASAYGQCRLDSPRNHGLCHGGLLPRAGRGGNSVVSSEEGPSMKLDELLSSRHIPFERLHHPAAYGANRIAQMLHVKGKDVAKPVLLRTENGYVIAVVPASQRVDLDRVRQCLEE